MLCTAFTLEKRGNIIAANRGINFFRRALQMSRVNARWFRAQNGHHTAWLLQDDLLSPMASLRRTAPVLFTS
jgi:hypothetical protein